MAVQRAPLALFAIVVLQLVVTIAAQGEPLFVSQYLPNRASEARALSKVTGLWKYDSYSGYITVNSTYFSNMFFWFFPAQNGDADAPILLWLQGGPGAASMYGLFSENGPFSVASDGKTLVPRKITWNDKYAMLYIDNPCGAGYSFTSSPDGFVTSQDEVATNLYSALVQFFQVFPDYSKNPFYVTGESYAGKYVPSISHKIYLENTQGNGKINLQGLAIGDGATDPLTMFTGYSDLLYYLGLADENEVAYLKSVEAKIVANIKAEQYVPAFELFDAMLNGDFYKYPTYYTNITGTTNYFNFGDPDYPPNPYQAFLNLASTRKAIHVGTYGYWDYNQTVEFHLIGDWMKSVAEVMPDLLNNYKVLVYNGQLDIILGAPLAEKFYKTIPWEGRSDYLEARKIVWKAPGDNNEVAGFVRAVRNFRQVVVRGAGHMVPQDQPIRAYDMITRFIDDKPFDS